MSELLKLAERCEAATGPDRELDAAITIAHRGFPERAYQQRNGMRPKGSPNIDRIAFMQDGWAERYTVSLDAAMTLVPEGVAWTLDGGDPSCPDSASLGPIPGRGEPLNPRWESEAANPALALCAAALRALAAQEPSS